MNNTPPAPLKRGGRDRVITIDASVITIDASAITIDASVITIDASVIAIDASVITIDASVITIDTSVITIDASVIAIEAKDRAEVGSGKWEAGRRGEKMEKSEFWIGEEDMVLVVGLARETFARQF